MSAMAARRARIFRFPTPPPKRPAPGRDAAELVEARRCRDQTEAVVVRGLLESEGIAADLPRALAVLARA
jgi:hypothetical protein